MLTVVCDRTGFVLVIIFSSNMKAYQPWIGDLNNVYLNLDEYQFSCFFFRARLAAQQTQVEWHFIQWSSEVQVCIQFALE